MLTTCNYEARPFGVHSAMPTAQALRLCPELIVLPVDMPKYRQASTEIRNIMLDYSDQLEPLSLDEAYLDLSDSPHFSGSATRIAERIRQRVYKEVGITISAGVAPNKFLAKVASDWQKPDGLTVIRPEQVATFVKQLPVKRIPGVGPVTAAKLQRMGVQDCADLQQCSMTELSHSFGRFGARLYELCRGLDDRPVSSSRERKSLSVEHTLSEDLPDLSACEAYLPALTEELVQRLARQKSWAPIHKLFVKLRFNDFSRTTAECLSDSVDNAKASELLLTAWQRKSRPVRLLGVGVRFRSQELEQLDLFAHGSGLHSEL